MADTTHALAPTAARTNHPCDRCSPGTFGVVADVDQADRAMQLLSGSANQRGRQWQQQ